MYKKAQAAMEFLMTYGWAILVVLVVIGALGYFGVLSPTALLPEKCMFGVELACKDFKLDGTAGKVSIQLQNNLGQSMSMTKFEIYKDDKVTKLCEVVPAGTDPKAVNSATLGNGVSALYEVAGCADLNAQKGQKVKVYVYAFYKKGGASGLEHRVEGEIFALVQ